MSVLNLILTELNKVEHKKTPGNYVVVCPFHQDTNPSLNISIDEGKKVPLGWCYCMSCGASKSWNEYASVVGLAKMTKESIAENSLVVRPIKNEIKDNLLSHSESMTFNDLLAKFQCFISEDIEVDDNWRGFSGRMLSKIGCKSSVDGFGNRCLIMPVLVDGTLVGGIKALWEPTGAKGEIKYQNMVGNWSKTHGLFPYDNAFDLIKRKNLNYIVLVEGSRDALRLIKHSVPAIAILGTQSWGKLKQRLVLELPVEKVIVFMDGDRAGIEATNKITKTLRQHTIVQPIKTYEYTKKLLEEGGVGKVDPGNMNIRWLKRLIKTF